jgi:hypothetical protein
VILSLLDFNWIDNCKKDRQLGFWRFYWIEFRSIDFCNDFLDKSRVKINRFDKYLIFYNLLYIHYHTNLVIFNRLLLIEQLYKYNNFNLLFFIYILYIGLTLGVLGLLSLKNLKVFHLLIY